MQVTAYEMRISDWSSDVCSSDLYAGALAVSDSLSLAGGANLFGGDSLSVETGGGATASANNTGYGAGAKAGDDTVTGGNDGNRGGGDSAEDRKSTRLNSSH